MYRKMQFIVMFLLVFSATTAWTQQDAFMGTWKLNVAKSKYNPGPAPKSTSTKREPSGANGVKYTSDTVTAQGETHHIEYTANYDGKDYPVKGDPTRDMTTLKKLDSHSYEGTSKKAGKVTSTFRAVVSPDGKTMTTTTKGTNAQGQPENNVVVYDRQ
jgi:hypothetical protein